MYIQLTTPLTEEKVRFTAPAKIRSEYNKLAKSFNSLVNQKTLYCHKCGQFYDYEDFYEDKRFASGRFPVCRECLTDMASTFDKHRKMLMLDKEKAKETLRFMDLPYMKDAYAAAVNWEKNPEKTAALTGWQYLIRQTTGNARYKDLHWDDSQFEGELTQHVAAEVRPEIYKIFGDGFPQEEYMYLQSQYDDLKARTTVDTKSQEIYAVRICFDLMKLWKADRQGKDTKELERSLNDLMAAANLQPRQNAKNAANDTLTFGQMIEKWETEKPIPEPDEEFKDVNGIGKLIRVFFSGHLAKALGLKNAYSEEYEEEMDKYTVRKFEAREDEMSDVYQNIFGAEESQ